MTGPEAVGWLVILFFIVPVTALIGVVVWFGRGGFRFYFLAVVASLIWIYLFWVLFESLFFPPPRSGQLCGVLVMASVAAAQTWLALRFKPPKPPRPITRR